MSPRRTAPFAGQRGSEAGFSLVALVASMTIMLVLMGAAMPSWKYVMQNEREQELFFRGDQIATAVERYQKKNGGTAPPTLEVLVNSGGNGRLHKEPLELPIGREWIGREPDHGRLAKPSLKPLSDTGMPMPSSGVLNTTKIAVVPVES